ncbi:hypothetical protein RB614_11250 [Phytohabitans sp. ZYX-F-186]|uniref:Uncharacterized protein n=1 Tax=Phytohabitans maris TaxID=3071409 RepID=A0ABU0ZDH2_9ACTN|nr:hypothetical protein [Phytohabitans sp. ZYX-F-186]MDQ7905097.1 hypothetical protein [Phytohabitans sp. ZYX-F-186]
MRTTRIATDLHLDVMTYQRTEDPHTTRRLRALLVDEVLDSECFNYREIFDRMMAGEPVFRTGRTPPQHHTPDR